MATATYTPLATTTLGSAASSITFSSIPSTYTDLRVIFTSTTTIAGANFLLYFNNDSGTNYSYTYLNGSGSAASSGQATGTAYGFAGSITTGSNTSIPNFIAIDVFSYAGSTYKTALCQSSNDQNGSGDVSSIVNLWRSTSAINRVDITCNGTTMKTGSTATLYGITKA